MLINSSQRARGALLALVTGAMLVWALPVQAVSYSWTNTVAGSTGYWTNGVLWGQLVGTYPGSVGPDEAYLTNQFVGTATTILDSQLNATISNLAISNALGEAWLIVTNGATNPTILTNTALRLGSGGRLQIDNGGVVTGITTFTWLGNDGTIYLNAGGKLFSGGALTIGSGISNVNATVSSLSGPGLGGVWSLNNQALTIGTGAAAGNVLTITAGANVTNVGAVTVGNSGTSRGNGLVILDGSSFRSGTITIGNAAGASNNYYTVGGSGAAVTVSNGVLNVGKGGGNDNTMVVTNANLWTSGLNIGNNGNSLLGATNNSVTVLANTTWNLLAGNVVIGSDGLTAISNSLTVNGGLLTNVGVFLQVGGGTGGGAQNGSYSTLLITNGGVIMREATSQLSIGFQGGSNNALIVTGTGSVLKTVSPTVSSTLNVGGGSGISNRLIIADGGQVLYRASTIQIGAFSGSNAVLVTDPGSVWSNSLNSGGMGAGYGFGVGAPGTSGNSLTITNAGVLYNVGGTGGNDGNMVVGGAGGQSNWVLVTGSGSVWSNANVSGSSLFIGSSGGAKYNSVTIADGAKYFANSVVILGNSTGANSNSFNIGSAGLASFVSNGAITVGGAVGANFNTLTVTNATLVSNYGTIGSGASNSVSILTNGTWNLNGQGLLVGSGGSSYGNTLTVNGGALLTNAGQIALGGVNNALLVHDSGKLSAASFRYSGATVVTVTDPSSVMEVSGLVSVGNQATLVVSNGGRANVGLILPGYFDGGVGTNGTILVTGPGSVLTGSSYMWMGLFSSSNYVTVADQAVLVTPYTVVGGGGGGTYLDNTLIVTGGASLTNTSNATGVAVQMGNTGVNIGAKVIVSAGGVLVNLNGATQIGAGSAGTSNNSLLVTGNGSVYSNVGGITVGTGRALNSLTVTNNGKLFSGDLSVGSGSGASSNRLTITDGGQLFAGNVTVGTIAGAINNSVLVENGSVLQASGLIIGGGTGNTISNVGGIFQFTAAPPITSLTPGDIAITDGTISFRATAVANVTNTVANQINKIRFAGANTFQLNNASNTAATVSQKYTFDTVGGNPSNYAHLAMINGSTAYGNVNGADITIGTGGAFLASNTLASITGLFTNNGVADIVDATVNFQSDLHVAGTLTLRNGFITGSAAKTIAGTLRGNGTVVGDATITGDLSPGLSIGTLVFSNDLTLAGSYQAEFGDGGNDQLFVIGTLTLTGSTLAVTQVGVATGEAFVIATYGTLVGTNDFVTGLPVGYAINYNYNGANQIAIVVVPEPGTLALVICGLVASWLVSRRRDRCQSAR